MAFDPATLPDACDIAVVGSGSGGAAVTRRLVEAGWEVTLIEAGGDGRPAEVVADPTQWIRIAGTEWDWGHAYAPRPQVDDRAIPIPRGRILGGSGQINAMMWYRGHPADYDAWAEMGCDGWRFEDCLPAFRRCEDWPAGGALRGQGGPLRVAPPADPHPLALALVEAAWQAGMPVLDDPNGPSNEGAALANLNIRAGRRFGPAEGYLAPVLEAPNLTVALATRALAILWRGDRAAGLRLARRGGTVELTARRGVVLAAGAFETPRLLMLSGAGPEAALSRLGLPARLALPELGENLADHPLVRGCVFRARRTMPPPRDNGGGAILNWRSDPALPRPDLHAFAVPGRSATAEVTADHALPDAGVFSIVPGLMGSRSTGRMALTSADPAAPLHLDPGFLTDPADRTALLAGIEQALDLAARPALAAWTDGALAPGPDRERFLRCACSTFYHPCGTARMGRDPGAVTTPRLRVAGAEALWIADASVIPRIPSCNTHAPVTMIGERAAEFILEDA